MLQYQLFAVAIDFREFWEISMPLFMCCVVSVCGVFLFEILVKDIKLLPVVDKIETQQNNADSITGIKNLQLILHA